MGVSSRPFPGNVAVRTGAERATLVRRTYMLVFAGVIVTMLGAMFGFSQPGIMGAVARHPFLSMIGMFVPLMLAQTMRDRFPANIGLTLAFTFAVGVIISPALWVAERQTPGIIMQTGLLTGSTFAVLTAYAFLSRRDFSAWGGFLTVGVWVLFATSLLNIFFRNEAASLWIAGVGTMLFGALLVFDTWRLRNQFGPDDYVIAAVTIYLDLLNIFMFILRLLGGGRRD